ncbi:MAG: hypothetical protein K2I18_06875 [Paramuribaculum sp.]|nr:hypothetical protein [Paramuribaculum sp.]
MAYIDCVVDTNPMAHSINTVTHNINGTTAAVVGMKAAVIKAEQDAAEHVCSNVNRGFYTLIRSQISQKMAKLRSEVDSHLMQLNQQRKQLVAIRNRMERDYNLTSARYLKTFTTINRNLKQRVYELDRPVMDFATKDMEQVTNRTSQLTAIVPLSQEESVKQSQHIIASNIKYRGMQVVRSASRFLEGSRELNDMTAKVLLTENISEASRHILYPAMVCESRIDASDNRSTAVYVTDHGISQQAQGTIRTALSAAAVNAQWTPAPVSRALAGEFGRLVDSSGMSQRAKDMAMKMFNAAQMSTLKDGAL